MSLPSSMIYNESYLNFGCGPFINRRIQPKGCRIFLFDITTSTADSLGREYLGEIRKGNQLWTRQLRYWALVRYCQDASALHIPEPGYVVTYRTALVSFHFKRIALHFLSNIFQQRNFDCNEVLMSWSLFHLVSVTAIQNWIVSFCKIIILNSKTFKLSKILKYSCFVSFDFFFQILWYYLIRFTDQMPNVHCWTFSSLNWRK